MTEPLRMFDAHLHIIDPTHPLVANDGFLPDPFTVTDYRSRVAHLGTPPGLEPKTPHSDAAPPMGPGSSTAESPTFAVAGGAVVSGSFQAFDQGYLVEALRVLGPTFVGVTQLPADTLDARIRELAAAGVRAVRFNVARGGSAHLDDLDRFARRVHDLAGWHTELYIDARSIDSELAGRLAALPAVCIDHLGMHSGGLPTLLRLVERGVRVKATGFGRVDLDPAEAVRRIVDTDPSALMVGTDLPSTRARRPFADDDLRLIADVLTPAEADAVFWDNAADFYLGESGTRG